MSELAETVEALQRQARDQARSADWAPLRALSTRVVPGFPVEALPSRLAGFVEGLAESSQTPVDLAAALSLGVIGGVLTKRVEVRLRLDWAEPTNLYIVCALASGERKSSVYREVMRAVQGLEARLANEAAPAVQEAVMRRHIAEAQAKRLADEAARGTSSKSAAIAAAHEAALIQVPATPRLLADDTTAEAFASLLAKQGGRLIVASPEGGLFDGLGRYEKRGATNLDAYLKAYSGDELRVDRKGRDPEFVPVPLATILLAVQPSVIEGLASRPEFRGRGLLARCSYVVPDSRVGHRASNPPPMQPAVRHGFEMLIEELATLPLPDSPEAFAAATLRLSSSAGMVLTRFRETLEPRLGRRGDLALVADWANKLPGTCLRIAAILHMIELGTSGVRAPISETTMTNAIVIGRYLLDHALAALRHDGGRSDTRRRRARPRLDHRTSVRVVRGARLLPGGQRLAS